MTICYYFQYPKIATDGDSDWTLLNQSEQTDSGPSAQQPLTEQPATGPSPQQPRHSSNYQIKHYFIEIYQMDWTK